MDPVTHFIVAWLIAVPFALRRRDMWIVVIAGVIADIDGALIIVSIDDFARWHHTFGHSYVFLGFFIIAASLVSVRKGWVALLSFLAFSAHLALDIFGTNWPVNPFYPFFNIRLSVFPFISGEVIYSVIYPAFFVSAIVLMVVVIMYWEKSPLGLFSRRLDSMFVGFFLYPLKHRCNSCGGRAYYRCDECGRYFCWRHADREFKTKCRKCREKRKDKSGRIKSCSPDRNRTDT